MLLLLLACHPPAKDEGGDTQGLADSAADSATDSGPDSGETDDTQDTAEDPIDPHCVGGVAAWIDTSGVTFPTIQAAADASTSRDTVIVCPGSWVETITVNNYSLLLQGYGADLTSIDGGDRPMITVGEGSFLLVRRLGMRSSSASGASGGAIAADGAIVTLEDVVFEDNAGAQGGAVAVRGGELYAERCSFVRNGGEVGGAIAAADTVVTLVDTSLDANEATTGAALALNRTTLTMTRGAVTRNAAGELSGALAIDEASVVTVSTSDWGSGATDNTPHDVDATTSFGADASFTCAAGVCE